MRSDTEGICPIPRRIGMLMIPMGLRRVGRQLAVTAARAVGRRARTYAASAAPFIVTPVALGAGLSAGAMALFFNIADDVRGTEGVTRFDHDGLRLALALRTPRRTSIMRFASNSARPDVMSYIGALALALTWRTSHRPKGVLLAVALSGGAGLIGLMKQRYGRERQTLIEALVREGTFSFPSGHAFISLTFYGLISGVHLRSDRSFAEKTAVCITSAGTTLLIGSSRVYLGAHYPSDVLAGYAAAVPWLTALLIANSQYEDRVERRAIAAAEAKK